VDREPGRGRGDSWESRDSQGRSRDRDDTERGSDRGRRGRDDDGRSDGRRDRDDRGARGRNGREDGQRDRGAPDASRAPRISPYARELVPEGWEALPHERDGDEGAPARERNRDRDRDAGRGRGREPRDDRSRETARDERDWDRAPRAGRSEGEAKGRERSAEREEPRYESDRPARERTREYAEPVPEGLVKMHLNVGYADGFRETQITQAIAELAQINERDVTRVAPHRRYSFFFVPMEAAEQVISKVRESEFQGKTLTADRAKERRGDA
jgi:hypothetical protein